MGAWGTGLLDNDDAADLLLELEDASPEERPELLRGRLADLAAGDGYLEGPVVSEGLAAAVVTAALLDPGSAPQEVRPLVEGAPRPDPELVRAARAACARAQETRDNEWHDLWAEAGEWALVARQVADLETALAR